MAEFKNLGEFVANNDAYVAGFSSGGKPMPPARKALLITCMDVSAGGSCSEPALQGPARPPPLPPPPLPPPAGSGTTVPAKCWHLRLLQPLQPPASSNASVTHCVPARSSAAAKGQADPQCDPAWAHGRTALVSTMLAGARLQALS